MDRENIESRRADNQVWNGAQDYSIRPEFRAFDRHGDAELYFNTVIGLLCRYYDFEKFRPLFNAFQSQPHGDFYSDLFWLGLEGAAFERAVKDRPVLDELRKEYARSVLAGGRKSAVRGSIDDLRGAWYQRALGEPEKEDEWEKGVLDALSFPPELSERQITERMEELLYRYFRRARRSITDRQWAAWVDRSINGKGNRSGAFVKRNALRRLGQYDGGSTEGTAGKARRAWMLLQGKTPEPVLRRYVEDVFGASMLTPAELAEAEHELCTGIHRNCRLHFTRGAPAKREVSRETAWDIESFKRQRVKNREYFQEHIVQNRLVISQLAQKLQNTILLQRDVSENLSRAGRVSPPNAWRGSALSDEKIFLQRRQAELGELSVDILLDGSASQNRQQEKLSTQAFIIAESLSRCQIPVRVSSYCSISGCTVLRVLRDYNESGGNDAIFDYAAAGWNRDGLAMRAIGWLMRRSHSDHRLLIILSDANPNDDEKIPGTGIIPGGKIYGGKLGVQDAAAEAANLRRQGIAPVCVFTGSDMELEGARKIYGRDLARIPSAGWFADTVGKLIQGRIKEL